MDASPVVVAIVVIVMAVTPVIMVVTSEDVGFVAKSGVSAGEDISARADHVWGESKLLAVEDEDSSVFGEGVFNILGSLFEVSDSLLPIAAHICVLVALMFAFGDHIVVLGDAFLAVFDAVFVDIDFVIDIDKSLSEGLKSDHELCFSVESLLVLVLIIDLLPSVEVVDLVPEVASWDASSTVVSGWGGICGHDWGWAGGVVLSGVLRSGIVRGVGVIEVVVIIECVLWRGAGV